MYTPVFPTPLSKYKTISSCQKVASWSFLGSHLPHVLKQPVFWFQECSLPTELCDKHQALKKLQRSIAILIMTLLNNFFPIPGKTSQPISLGRFSPSVPLFIYSYPLPPSANSWPSFSAFGRRQKSSLERRFGIRLGRGRKSGWRSQVYLLFSIPRESEFRDL